MIPFMQVIPNMYIGNGVELQVPATAALVLAENGQELFIQQDEPTKREVQRQVLAAHRLLAHEHEGCDHDYS